MKNLSKLLLYIIAAAISYMSAYFNTGFFTWLGFTLLNGWVLSGIIVFLLNLCFQSIAKAIKEGKYALLYILIPVEMILICTSVTFTVFGMWYQIDAARNNRGNAVIEQALVDPELVLIDEQIKRQSQICESIRSKYDDPINGWWVRERVIAPALKIEEDSLRKFQDEKKAILQNTKKQNAVNEIAISKNGTIPGWIKVLIGIAIDFILDLGSCILVMLTWIFSGKKETTVQDVQPDLTPSDYVSMYFDLRVVSASRPLRGKSSVIHQIPDEIYREITEIAIRKKIIKHNNTKMFLTGGAKDKDTFTQKIVKDLKRI